MEKGGNKRKIGMVEKINRLKNYAFLASIMSYKIAGQMRA